MSAPELDIRQWDGPDGEMSGKWYCSRKLNPPRVEGARFCSHEYLHANGQWRTHAYWFESRDQITFEEEI